MSRIDQALRKWEGAADTAAGEPAERPDDAPHRLQEYPRERPTPDTPEPLPAIVTEPAPSVTPIGRQVLLPSANGDSRARLVTGGASQVSLEQYRRLAAALHEAQAERGLKTLMITSALPGEGKTLTTVNVALTLSESYARRVLVIDADLRWPSLHSVLNVKNVRGLSEALVETGEPQIIEVSSRLSVMTAGQPGPTPLASLSSVRMGTLLEECAERFDWVLVDTSPIGLLPDGQVLARLIGAVILVIRAGMTPAAAVERAVADLGAECILGTVLNQVEEHRIPEAGYYARYRAPENS